MSAAFVFAEHRAGGASALIVCGLPGFCERSPRQRREMNPYTLPDRSLEALLHAVSKTAQTLMKYLSGIATADADIVAAARSVNPAIAVACTRKNFPGTKAASIKAVLCSGASPRRLNLSETLLVFAAHRAFLGDEAPAATVRRLRRQWPERSIVVEVGDEQEASLWQQAGADILQLERLPPEAVDRIRRALPPGATTRLAATGGITLANAPAYAQAGADILVTSAPYFAAPRDVAVTLAPATAP